MGDQTPKLQPTALQLTTSYDRKQRQKMILALVLLLVAIAIFVARDWHKVFGPADTSSADWDSDSEGGSRPSSRARKAPTALAPKPQTKVPSVAASHAMEPPPTPPAVVNRKALPPLEVEVVAGNSHRPVAAGNNTVRVDTGSDSASETNTRLSASAQAASNAGERVKMSVDTNHVLEKPVQPSYPMLARQMKVQGAVILQALIGADGAIQDLKVLSGPAILASAAQEAVRQWRFKPYLQNGVAVETEAKITVNFTISTL
ncbi:MAG TPA: TonB family protein [Terriglobales bacterium]|nr:TonB family protein [Terriglobales bacterium]